MRDLYRIDEGEHAGRLLMVASDRISAFDFVLDSTIPDKGEILTRMSLWWFDRLADLVPHHVVSTDVPDDVRGRAVICEALEMYPVECVARGYLAGSGLVDYAATGEVCGNPLPDGLVDGDRLPEPIFTPAAKAAFGEHDENVDYAAVVATVGPEAAADLRDLTLRVYGRAEGIARERGIILADTKIELGRRADGTVVLADEVLTPDSSRFWPARGVGARPRPAVVRQADRARLAALAGLGLGPRVRRGAAAAARRGRRADPGPLRRGLRAADRGAVPVTRYPFSTTVDLPQPPKVLFTYLVEPRNRPEWQASLLSVRLDERDAEPAVGLTWQDTTVVGVKPAMEITELVPYRLFSERGRWAGVEGSLTMRFVGTAKGCRLTRRGLRRGQRGVRRRGPRRRAGRRPVGPGRPAARLARAHRPRPALRSSSC